MSIKVVIRGAMGRMGQEAVQAIAGAKDLDLVAALGRPDDPRAGQSLAALIHGDAVPELPLQTDLAAVLRETQPDVCVDLTRLDGLRAGLSELIKAGVRPVIGTTGLSDQALDALEAELKQAGLAGAWVPNFSIGAVLMMRFAREAARYFEHAEIIELHHTAKTDAPSGTAMATAREMAKSREAFNSEVAKNHELLEGARGGTSEAGIPIHSVRLPGHLAHQEVIFGADGEALRLRHDTCNRKCFMPGVLLAVRQVMQAKPGLQIGLEGYLS